MAHQSVFRWRYDRPLSLERFQLQFPDDHSCAAYLAKKRWPDGFVCPHCGSRTGWKLRSKPWVWECGGDKADEHGELIPCRKQTSVIAGTIMHKTHLPLRQWFLAAHLVTTHSNGISALQLQAKLGIGSYKTAWLLLHKLRRAMVNPDREKLGGYDEVVEIDETSIPFRTKDEPVGGGQGRSPIGKLNVIGAVEWRDEGRSGRIRLEPIRSNGKESLHPFVLRNTAPHTTIFTDGNQAYQGIPDRKHASKVVGKLPAHLWFKRIHRVFSLLKRWMMGVYHASAAVTATSTSRSSSSDGTGGGNIARRSTVSSPSAMRSVTPVSATSSVGLRSSRPSWNRCGTGRMWIADRLTWRPSPRAFPKCTRGDCSIPSMSRRNLVSIGATFRRALSWPDHGRHSCSLHIH